MNMTTYRSHGNYGDNESPTEDVPSNTVLYGLGNFTYHQNLTKARSSDDNSLPKSSSRTDRRHYSNDNENNISNARNIQKDNLTNSFTEWVNYTHKLKNLVSKQIQECATNCVENECDDDSFELKDEDFFWNPNALSFDSIETSKTNRAKHESFSKWGQDINMWHSDRTGFSSVLDSCDSKEREDAE